MDEIINRWDQIKSTEKGRTERSESALDHVSRALPPLEKSFALQKKAAKVGFDWPDQGPVWEKIAEEMAELRAAAADGSLTDTEEELGDLLFTIVNLSRFLKVDPSVALNRTNTKFERRFREVERRLAAQGVRARDAGLARMDELWNQLKSEDGAGGAQKASK